MNKWKLFFASLFLCCGTCQANGTVAKAPAEAVFTTWIDAFNSGDPVKIQAYLDKYEKTHTVEGELEFFEATGGFHVLRVTNISPTETHAFIRQKNSDRALLATIIVDDKNTDNVVKFQLEGTELPDELKIKRLQLPALLELARERLDALEKADQISGALLVAQKGKVLFSWSGGKADRLAGQANNLETKFRIASVGKMFTAVAVLQLVEAGKISLDDSIAKHLGNYPDQSIAKRITIRQLLNHTSGLGDVFDDDFNKNSSALKTHSDYMRHYGSRPLGFDPGTQDAYSNFGYIVLGAIIESVSGQSYYDYVEQHVFKPAGMLSTGAEPESVNIPGRALAYTNEKGKWIEEKASLPWRGTAAGGCYSTVGDLLKFAQALQEGKLISSTLLEAATTPQNNKRWYGYGFMPSGKGDEHRYGHEGGATGMNAVVFIYPGKGFVVIGLSNFDPAAMGTEVNFVGNRLPM